MRLINVHTMRLDFFPTKTTRPPYAILSHRWSDNEANFETFSADPNLRGYGFDKIRSFCAVVRQQQIVQNVEHCWVDTCCIDKRSSAELSEAINSMASWYEASEVCIVYLSDVPPIDAPLHGPLGVALRASIYRSQWFVRFTRGWSLQELLFPPKLVFRNVRWSEIPGLEQDYSMLSAITAIPEKALQDRRNIQRYCVADRFSWAARRETTREEDASYCLLGLFGINMPLLYGEGKDRAFNRLQRAIVETSEDESIFAWVSASNHRNLKNSGTMPILAPQLSYFTYRERKHTNRAVVESRSPYRITNRGLEFEASAIEFSDHPYSHPDDQDKSVLLIQMNCTATYDECDAQTWLIALRRLSGSDHSSVYGRIFSWTSPFMISKIMMDFKKNNAHVTVRMLPPQKYYVAASYDQLRDQTVASMGSTETGEQAAQSSLDAFFKRIC